MMHAKRRERLGEGDTKTTAGAMAVGVAVALAAIFFAPANSVAQARGQKDAGPQGKTAGEYYENVKVLKDVPATELIPAMHYITTALGVGCEFCHDTRHFESDDKRPKKTARKMMEMMLAIDQNSFGGKQAVTCYTCHRGSQKPITTPLLPGEIAAAENAPAPNCGEEVAAGKCTGVAAAAKPAGNWPAAETIVTKYVEAIGGEKTIAGVTALVEKGTVEMGPRNMRADVEIDRKAPDKSVTTIDTPQGGMAHGFDGTGAWERFGAHVRSVGGSELTQEKRWGAIYPGADIASYYTRLQTAGVEKIDGQGTYHITGWPAGGVPENLYFDQKTGLLVRVLSLIESPLGALPKEIDYSDFREAGGMKVPSTIRVVQLNGTATYQFSSIQANAPVADSQFAMPAPKAEEK